MKGNFRIPVRVSKSFSLFWHGHHLRFLDSIFSYCDKKSSDDFSGRKCLSTSTLLLSVLLGLLFIDCGTANRERNFLVPRNEALPAPSVQKGKVFLAAHRADHTKDGKEILSLLNRLVEGTVRGDLSFLPEIVSPKEGIYLDLKGHWTRDQLIQELRSSNNYFQTYFFDRELLKKQKNSEDVRTVRDLFLLAGGVDADLYFEGTNACEVKLRFRENSELQSELINPYFIKSEGKWVLYRLF